MPKRRRNVFFVSDGTGLTAEGLGYSLLTQFEDTLFDQVRMPFVNTTDKAKACLKQINETPRDAGARPVVFSTLVNNDIRDVIRGADALVMDFFESFLDPLEAELGTRSSHAIGRSHSAIDKKGYGNRIDAVNFALSHDDGQTHRELSRADVILVGVSRSGKTPTSLYLALQFGILAANYPLIPEDFERNSLPDSLKPYRNKLFGLSIAPERLSEIRNERRPNSSYAEIGNCRREVSAGEGLMRREGIRWVNSTTKSIEEIATTIMQEIGLTRRVF